MPLVHLEVESALVIAISQITQRSATLFDEVELSLIDLDTLPRSFKTKCGSELIFLAKRNGRAAGLAYQVNLRLLVLDDLVQVQGAVALGIRKLTFRLGKSKCTSLFDPQPALGWHLIGIVLGRRRRTSRSSAFRRRPGVDTQQLSIEALLPPLSGNTTLRFIERKVAHVVTVVAP